MASNKAKRKGDSKEDRDIPEEIMNILLAKPKKDSSTNEPFKMSKSKYLYLDKNTKIRDEN